MQAAFIFMLILIEPTGLIIKPEAMDSGAACYARIESERAKGHRPNGYVVCVPKGAAVEMQPALAEAGS